MCQTVLGSPRPPKDHHGLTGGRPVSTENTHRRKVPRTVRPLRILLPALLVLGWVIAAAIGGPYFGRVDEVSSNDRTTYLPDSADATQVAQRAADFTGSESIPAIIVITSSDELDEEAAAAVGETTEALAEIDAVNGEISPAIPSEDGLAVQVFVPIDSDADLAQTITQVEEELAADLPEGLTSYVTGPAGFSADLAAGFTGLDGLLLGVALAAVFVILIIVYRSLLLPLIVLSTSVFALCAALLTIWHLAAADVLLLSGQTQGILFILVIGAATDYSLLYVARYRDELRGTKERWPATVQALRGTLEPVLASGGTVIAGLLCLLLSDLKSNSTLGPVAAIGIVFAMAGALTFLPAVLYVTGRVAFWPRRPHYAPEAPDAGADPSAHGIWGRVREGGAASPAAAVDPHRDRARGGLPGRHPAQGRWRAAVRPGARAVLRPRRPGRARRALPCRCRLPRAGDRRGVLAAGGDRPPAHPERHRLGDRHHRGLPQRLRACDRGRHPAPGPARHSRRRPHGGWTGTCCCRRRSPTPRTPAAAEQTVRDVRADFASEDVTALVGGPTATSIDTNDASAHDRALIIPVVLVVIVLILMLLLRSILAPVLLVATTVLSFGTAMGVAALVFNHLFDFPGADPAVPLYGFVFLVALGIDARAADAA